MMALLLALFSIITSTLGQITLLHSINENCPQYLNCSYVGLMKNASVGSAQTNLLHVWPTKKSPRNDFTHFFVSTVNYSPTFAAVVSHAENDVTLQWSSTDVKLIGSATRSIVTSLSGIYQYLDTEDVADVDKVDPNHVSYFSLIDMHWQSASIEDKSSSIAARYCIAEDPNTIAAFGKNASICFTARFFNDSGREKTPPRQEYTSDSDIIVEVELSNMKSIGKQTRYALDMQIVSAGPAKSSFAISEVTHINDEYTPGVFRTVYIQLNNSKEGYATWKPVSYKSKSKDRSSQTQTITNGVQPVDAFALLAGILNSQLFELASVGAYNVTLGYPKDKFYGDYASWVFMLGSDRPPVTEISNLLTFLIILSILVPLLGFLIVVAYLVRKKICQNREGFEPLVQEN